MNLLDTASLVVTPNGYKASKLYSIIPTDGTGDMTFARTGDTATRVNPSGLIETVLANKPRLDYLGSTCPKLLLEPQRTNLAFYSNDFDNAYWSKDASTITANNINSPNGTQNADLWTSTGANTVLLSSLINSAASQNNSIFVKYNNKRFVQLYSGGAFGDYVNFDIQNKVIGNYGNTTSNAKIEEYGNGWLRISATFSGYTGNTTIRLSMIDSLTTAWNSKSSSSGDAIYLYGFQSEAGAYATSYIPTTTASVTRNADGCEKTSISSLIGQTEGTVFFDLNIDSRISFTYLFVRNAATTNYIGFAITNTAIKGEVINSNATQANISYTANLGTGRFKLAIAYKANDFAFYVNGSLVGVDTSGTIPNCDILQLYYNSTNGLRVNSGVLWKTRLQNSELATLTTL